MNDPSPKPAAVSSRDPRLRTVAVALVASGAAALVGWSAARRNNNAAPLPAPPAQTAALAAPVAGTTPATTSGQYTPPAPEETEAVLNAIPDLRSVVPGAKNKKVDEVIARAKEAARAKPDLARNWIMLGDALMQKAREIAEPNYYDYAEKAYVKSLVLAPDDPEALLGIAWVTSTRHQFTDSISWAKRALVVAPRLHAAHGLIGDAYVETGDYEAAFQSYQTMLDIRPDVSSYSRGAHLLYITGDRRKAEWLMNKAVQAGGPYAENSAWCRAQLAEMYLSEGASFPARQIVAPALKLLPDNYNLLVEMGKIQQAEGDLKGAIVSYEKAVAVTPQHVALVALGDLYDATGDKQKAEAMYDQAEKTHDHHMVKGLKDELYMARFFADHDRNMDRALKIAEGRTDTENPVDADNVAWVFYKAGKFADAKTMINKSLGKGEPDASRLYHAGMIYAKLGDRFPAQEYLNRALALNPHFGLRDAPNAVAALRDLGSKPRPVALPSPAAALPAPVPAR